MKSNTNAPPGEADNQGLRISRKTLWTGRILSALPVLFLLMDGIMKLVKPEPVVKATIQLGYPESVIIVLGIILLVLFSHILFPVYLALLIWGGLFLRDSRLRALMPLRN